MARFENEEFVEVTDKDLSKVTNTTNTENTVGDEAPTEKLDETPTEKVEAEVVEENTTYSQNESATYYRNNPVNAPTEANEKKGMSIAGLVLGIVNVFGWLIPLVGVITGIVGIVLSAIAIKKENKKGMSITGLVLSIIGLIVSLIVLLIACVAAIATLNEGAYYGV